MNLLNDLNKLRDFVWSLDAPPFQEHEKLTAIIEKIDNLTAEVRTSLSLFVTEENCPKCSTLNRPIITTANAHSYTCSKCHAKWDVVRTVGPYVRTDARPVHAKDDWFDDLVAAPKAEDKVFDPQVRGTWSNNMDSAVIPKKADVIYEMKCPSPSYGQGPHYLDKCPNCGGLNSANTISKMNKSYTCRYCGTEWIVPHIGGLQ
jgi:predicted RNA-binding Zn-ribbon protein involved in translation (DUF1610 family)